MLKEFKAEVSNGKFLEREDMVQMKEFILESRIDSALYRKPITCQVLCISRCQGYRHRKSSSNLSVNSILCGIEDVQIVTAWVDTSVIAIRMD